MDFQYIAGDWGCRKAQDKGTASAAVTTPAFSTAAGNELLLAFNMASTPEAATWLYWRFESFNPDVCAPG
jgi:hypothetical protein